MHIHTYTRFHWCIFIKLEIFTPNNELLGSVKQTWSVMKPYYDIRDQNDSTVLKIVGPFCTCTCCCGDVEFEVSSYVYMR